MLKNKFLIFGLMALLGLGSGVAIMASAQSATTANTATPAVVSTTAKDQAVDTPEPGDVPDAPNGTDISANSASVSKGEHADKAGDKDGDPASEANEPAGSGDAGE